MNLIKIITKIRKIKLLLDKVIVFLIFKITLSNKNLIMI